jgi:hypothetical protein
MLKFQFGLVVLFLIGSFFKIGWLFAAGVSLFLALFHRERIIRRYYIYFQDDYFIIRHVVKPEVAIKKDQYMGISKPWSNSTFTTELTISFKDGRKFEFIAGDNRINEVEKAIRQLIYPAYPD